jgi:hypothetical protein
VYCSHFSPVLSASLPDLRHGEPDEERDHR